jgi:uncharacterized cupin superfamily protein
MPKTAADIIDFHVHQPDAQSFRPDAAKILDGDPVQTVWNHYEDATGQLSAGVWQGEPGRWRVRYTEHEFCHLLEGEVTLIDSAGEKRIFSAGASFVIPAGFEGVWETVERTRKLYVTFEPKSGA